MTNGFYWYASGRFRVVVLDADRKERRSWTREYKSISPRGLRDRVAKDGYNLGSPENVACLCLEAPASDLRQLPERWRP